MNFFNIGKNNTKKITKTLKTEFIQPHDENMLREYAEKNGWTFLKREKVLYKHIHEIEQLPYQKIVEATDIDGSKYEKRIWCKGEKTRILGEYNDTYVSKKTGFTMSCAGNCVPWFPECDNYTTRPKKNAPLQGHFPSQRELHFYMHGF